MGSGTNEGNYFLQIYKTCLKYILIFNTASRVCNCLKGYS